jgi:hypothetical protein
MGDRMMRSRGRNKAQVRQRMGKFFIYAAA